MNMPRRANNEGTIGQRKDGSWYAAISLPNGKRKWFRAKTRKAVVTKMNASRKELYTTGTVPTTRMTVATFLVWWLENVVKYRNRERTYIGYTATVHKRIMPAIGHIQLTKLTPDQVQEMLNAMIPTHAPRTIRNARAVLRRALNVALRHGKVSRNVATLVDTPKPRRSKITVLGVEQSRELIQAIQGTRWYAAYCVMLILGLRRGETMGLLWEDIDLKNSTLRVTGSLQHYRRALHRGEPKSEASSQRILHIPAALVDALTEHRQRMIDEGCLSEYVFVNEAGVPCDPSIINRHLDKIIEQINATRSPENQFPHVSPHCLRHNAASLMMAQGTPLSVVRDVLGHSSITVTADYYGHLLPASNRDATEAVTGLLFG